MNYKRVVIIDPLPDDVFVEIFDLCIRDPTKFLFRRMRKWLILAHVCQRWRRIIFASPHRLNLYLPCIRGALVRQNLVYWPLSFPLVIDYPGPVSRYDPTPGDEDNIVAALTHANRIHHVNVHGTSSLFGKMATVMQKSFPVLTRLELTWFREDWEDPLQFLPRDFLSGSAPRLEYLYLGGVSFPGFSTLLLSASNLLTLRLDDILQSIPPETMVAGLAVLTSLRTLSIAFREVSQPDQGRNRSNPPMPTILPALTLFHYKGCSEYLEDLFPLINTPLVNDIWIEYFKGEIQVPQLSRFIGHTKNLKDAQFRCAHVGFYYDTIDVKLELDLPQGKSLTKITLTLPGPWSNIPVPNVVDVLGQVVAIFSNVRNLTIHGAWLQWKDMDDLDSIEWLLFFRLFPAVETLHLYGAVVPFIVSALENITEEMLTRVMPALHLLWLDEDIRRGDYEPAGSIVRFLSLRQVSGRPVAVVHTKGEFDETLSIKSGLLAV